MRPCHFSGRKQPLGQNGPQPLRYLPRRLLPRHLLLLRLRASVRQQLFVLARNHSGIVLSWGSGPHGELGLGEGRPENHAPRPVKIPALRPFYPVPVDRQAREVSCGNKHALLITVDGALFSWGSGRDGRLGHGDYEDRWQPTQVKALSGGCCVTAAAGDAHSIAVVEEVLSTRDSATGKEKRRRRKCWRGQP